MLEEIPKNKEESRANLEWFVQHWAEINADPRYKNGFVAIQNGQIVDFDKDENALGMRMRASETDEARSVILAVTETTRQDVGALLVGKL